MYDIFDYFIFGDGAEFVFEFVIEGEELEGDVVMIYEYIFG